MNEVMRREESAAELMETVLIKGDLSKLTPQERTDYYLKVCQSLSLNPLTMPFRYLSFQGQLQLYATRACTDQLRKINGISTSIKDQRFEKDTGLFIVTMTARDRTGRTDEDIGALNMAELRGEARSNAMMKTITKAKRRVTLSISGLGFPDETEAEDIEGVDAPQRAQIEHHAAALEQAAGEKVTEVPKGPDAGGDKKTWLVWFGKQLREVPLAEVGNFLGDNSPAVDWLVVNDPDAWKHAQKIIDDRKKAEKAEA